MKLSVNGPDIPVSFLNRLQDDKVVFFCGAGVSVRSRLPDFRNLVKNLFSEYGEPFNGRRYDYDQMLEELENKYGDTGVRKKIRQILSPSESVSNRRLENHCYLLRLASVEGDNSRVRLVTTNFDDRFQRAAKLKDMPIKLDDSPKLPMPEDGEEWASLVHLHGRISEEDQTLKSLVLTSSDFGRAYLVQGWARRFVVQLLREWHVVFVGYGLNDPMLRYLMDATAALRRRKKNSFKDSYAFVPCRAGREDETRNIWKKKGVSIPIPYRKGIGSGAHSLLWKTLGDIANLKENPIHSRKYFALTGTELMPEGDNAERVVWALKKPAIAEEFAKQKDIADGDKFVRWLDAFKEAGLFRADNAAPVNALDYPQHSLYGPPLPPVAGYLALWAARHVHQPALLWWLASSDGTLHPQFIWRLLHCVNGADGVNPKEMPDQLAEKWNLHIQDRLAPPFCELLFTDLRLAKKKSEWVKSNWEQRFITALRPYPRIVPASFPSVSEDQGQFETAIMVGCEMDRTGRWMHDAGEYARKYDFVVRHAEALAAYLEDAASLMRRCGIDTHDVPCIHEDTPDAPHWKFLALLVRNAVWELIRMKNHRRLTHLISGWVRSEHPLLWRLALYAATEATKHFPEFRKGGNWGAKFLTENLDALWGSECRPECLRFLRITGAKITPSVREELERVISKGPQRSMYPISADERKIDEYMQREVAVRLAKLEYALNQSMAKLSSLSSESADILRAARQATPEVEFENSMEPHYRIRTFQAGDPDMPDMPGAPKKQAMPKWSDMKAEECADFIQSAEWLDINSFVKEDPKKAVESFEILAKREFWERDKWSLFLSEFGRSGDILDGIAIRLVRLLEAMPEELALTCVRDCAYVMRSVSEALLFSEMEKAWRRMWEFDLDDRPSFSSSHHISQLDIAINHAHGQLAEVPLICFRHEKEREKLKNVFAEILASDKKSHRYGKILIASRLSMLFHNSPEWAKWAKQHLLPFFAPEHSMAFGMWEAFLYSPTVSVDLLDALKPGLVHFLKCVDTFYSRASNLVGIFVIGCQMHPGIISRNEKRQIVSGMNPQGIQYLCGHMERELRERDQDGATLAKAWRELVFPFLREVWSEKRWPPKEASEISRALASVIMLTGDAFPEAFEWAQDFLWPIIGYGGGHPITALCYGHQKWGKNIPKKFPRECLQFLRRIIPDESFGYRHELGLLLDGIKASNPELEKHSDFIHLREIASGG